MARKIRTEADRKFTPQPPAPIGVVFTTGRGQKISLERGSHTRSKKNPGKRPHSG
jgi:2-methylcitrate dehydratase PrpD